MPHLITAAELSVRNIRKIDKELVDAVDALKDPAVRIKFYRQLIHRQSELNHLEDIIQTMRMKKFDNQKSEA